VAFRFDPLFKERELFDGKNWRNEYKKIAEIVMTETNPLMITLGAYRPGPSLKSWIARYFPHSPLFKLKVTKQAGKCRIEEGERRELIDFVLNEIRALETKLGKKVPVSYCKETVSFWKNSQLAYEGRPRLKCNCVPM